MLNKIFLSCLLIFTPSATLLANQLDDLTNLVNIPPPMNPYLSESNNSISHSNSAQQDSVLGKGPTSASRVLEPVTDITYLATGPFQFGQSTSSKYIDGRRVLWGSGSDRIVKIDQDSHKVLATLALPERNYFNIGQGLDISKNLDALDAYEGFEYVTKHVAPLIADLSGAYTMIDKDNNFIVGRSEKLNPDDKNSDYQSSVVIYADEIKGNPDSAIIEVDM